LDAFFVVEPELTKAKFSGFGRGSFVRLAGVQAMRSEIPPDKSDVVECLQYNQIDLRTYAS
jgi:hypothetical protein